MIRASRFLFFILTIQCLLQVNVYAAADECSGLSTVIGCMSNQNCVWKESDTSACSNKTDCSQYYSQTHCGVFGYQGCKWSSNVEQNCLLRPLNLETCKLNDDQTACNNPYSCSFTQSQQASCKPKRGSFDCDKNTTPSTCNSQVYCNWTEEACQSSNKCETLSNRPDCEQSGSFCKFIPSQCQLNPNSMRICVPQKTQSSCEAANCVWQAQKCISPNASACYVIPSQFGDSQCSIRDPIICQATSGTCKTAENACNAITMDQCSSNLTNGFCKKPDCIASDKCQTLPKIDCLDPRFGGQFCNFVPLQCQLNPNSMRICVPQKTQSSCEAANCVWQAQRCIPPDASACNLITLENGGSQCGIDDPNICQISVGICKTKQDVCESIDRDSCSSNLTNGFCQGKSKGCQDIPDYCQVESCERKADQCTFTKGQDASCTSNSPANECTSLTTQSECLSNANCYYYDSYNCKQTQQCSKLSSIDCISNQLCTWNTDYAGTCIKINRSYSID